MTGLVLAGGLSTRFGSDKSRAVLPCGTGDMVDFSLSLLAPLVDEGLAVSCRPDQMERLKEKGVTLIPDEESGRPTPLRGLVAALRRTHSALFVIPCDLPFMTSDVLALLVEARKKTLQERSKHGGTPLLRTTFIDEKGFLESLTGIYEAEGLPYLEDALRQGRLGIWSALPMQSNCLLPRPDASFFLNMNTREEFARASELLASRAMGGTQTPSSTL